MDDDEIRFYISGGLVTIQKKGRHGMPKRLHDKSKNFIKKVMNASDLCQNMTELIEDKLEECGFCENGKLLIALKLDKYVPKSAEEAAVKAMLKWVILHEAMIVCSICGERALAETAHLHQNGHIGECCWDERLTINKEL